MADDDRAPAQTLVDLIERRRHDHRVGLVLHDHVWTWAGAVAERLPSQDEEVRGPLAEKLAKFRAGPQKS